jgi:hypothetical protein
MGEPAYRNEHGQFAPGVSGNPTGRPKVIRDLEDKLLELWGPKASDVMGALYAMAMEQGREAPQAARVFLDRLLGKPRQQMADALTDDAEKLSNRELWERILAQPAARAVALEVLQGGKK